VLNQCAIKQIWVGLEERLEALGTPALHVYRDELQPCARESLVVLVLGAVPSSNVPDGCGHDAGRPVKWIEAQLCPRELEVLAMAEAAAGLDDLLKDLEVTFPYGRTVAAARKAHKGASGADRLRHIAA
jgi:hypothetical protein